MAPTKTQVKANELKKQQEEEALLALRAQQEEKAADSDAEEEDSDAEEEDSDAEEEDSDAEEENSDAEEEAPPAPKPKAAKPQAPKPKTKAVKAVKEAEPKPRRTFVDPLEIKELILLDTKGGKTKAGKLLDRLGKQLEKIMTKMAKKKEAGPRKLSAYNVFTQKHMADVQKLESKLRMKELGQRWKKLSDKEKAKYQKLATEANAARAT